MTGDRSDEPSETDVEGAWFGGHRVGAIRAGIARLIAGQWYFPLAVEELTPDTGRQSRRRLATVVGVCALLGTVLYWWWPGITGSTNVDSEPAVLVVGNGQLSRSEEAVLRRLREEGYSAAWASTVSTWCDVSGVLTEGNPAPTRAVVMHIAPTTEQCDDPAAVAADIRASIGELGVRALVVVGLEEGDRIDPVVEILIDSGLVEVDPSSLIGTPGEVDVRTDCLWWDDCIFEGTNPGYVIARDDDGLTVAGQQRVARLIVATVQ